MVVMEDLSSEEVTIRPRISRARAAEFQKKVKDYHSHGFVHGEIRRDNALIVSSSKLDCGEANPDHCTVKLVDFDWSGRKGEVHYPYLLNMGVYRPKGVQDGALILAEHDEAGMQSVIEPLFYYL
jgi:hypothetical protein